MGADGNPLVSIVIPVKNGMPYLRECIESLISSSYKNLEIIVSDDGSIDGSVEYLTGLQFPNLRVISPPIPMGIGAHWSYVSAKANGAYIKLLCSDDFVTQNGIANQVRALELNSQVTMVSSRRTYIDPSGRTILNSKKFDSIPLTIPGKQALIKSLFAGTNIFGEPSSVMFRTEVFTRFLPWDDMQPYLLDFEFYARLLLGSEMKVVFLPTLDATFRIHGVSLSSQIHSKNSGSLNVMIKKFGTHFNFSKPQLVWIRVKSFIRTVFRSIVFLAVERLRHIHIT